MKKLPIRQQITLWYTVLMVFITVIILFFISLISGKVIAANTQEQLKSTVSEGSKYITYKKESLRISENLETYDDGIYLSVYDSYENLLYGRVPRVFNIDTPFYDDQINSVSLPNSETLYYYDTYTFVEGYGNVWIRGVVSYSGTQKMLQNIIFIAFILLPVLVVFVLLGGYLITKRGFEPVEKIRKTAEEISKGDDLNNRIGLVGNKDEIYELANTFDNMLDRLENAFQREKQFTSDISHELRTPIAIIRLKAEKILSNETINPQIIEDTEIIAVKAQEMANLVASLLTLARAETGVTGLEMEKNNLSELMLAVVEEQEELAHKRNIEIHKEIAPDIFVVADGALLIRLLINLVSNAITYNKENGQVNVTVVLEANDVVVKISDTGIGIAEENLDKIWNRFYQVDASRGEFHSTGAGLGLSMVAWIIQRHKWDVNVDSTLGVGTTVTIKIPQIT